MPHLEVYSNGNARKVAGTEHGTDDASSPGFEETTKLLTRNLEEEVSIYEVPDEHGEVCTTHHDSGVIFQSGVRFEETINVE
jgi:hypothetical protein